MIIARDVKIVPRAAGEWENTSSAITLYNIFLRLNKKTRKNNDKQQFSPVRRVKNSKNTHFLHDRRQTVDRCVQ
jgi:hypothetical protein